MQWLLHHNKKKQTNDVSALWMPLKFIIMSGKSQSKKCYILYGSPLYNILKMTKLHRDGEHSSG